MRVPRVWTLRSAVIAGVVLILVPTLFSIFPHWAQWSVTVRVLVVVAWALVAWFVVTATVRQSSQVDDLIGEPLKRRGLARTTAAQVLLHALLRPGVFGLPGTYELRLFLPDEHGMLVAEYESSGSTPSVGWKPGQGATGMAWAINGMVVAQRPYVSDGTYGLTEEQQDKYSDLAVVAASPVQNARSKQIGVIAASSTVDDGYFDTPDGQISLVALCEVVARVLVDVRRIAHD